MCGSSNRLEESSQNATTSPTLAASSITNSSLSKPTAGPLNPSLSVGAQAAIGVSVPFAVLVAVATLVLGFRRHRKNKRMDQATDKTIASPNGDQPYFQQKGELDAKESALFELSAEQRQHELGSQSEICEMSAETSNSGRTVSQRQELRGEEHCQELMGRESCRNLE